MSIYNSFVIFCLQEVAPTNCSKLCGYLVAPFVSECFRCLAFVWKSNDPIDQLCGKNKHKTLLFSPKNDYIITNTNILVFKQVP